LRISALDRSPINESAPAFGVGRSWVREWVEHASELELRIEAPSAEDAVAEATAALGDVLGEPDDEPVTRELQVEGGDPGALLAAWLEELIFLAEQDLLIPQEARGVSVGEGVVRGQLVARRGRPSHLVKAVTYHRLALERGETGWRATVVLDV